MQNIIVIAVLVLVVGSASYYIWKEKRRGENALDVHILVQRHATVNK